MPSSFARRLATRLRANRVARGLTQAELAEATGVSTNYVSVLERGEKVPALETLLKLASALATPAGDLIDVDPRVPRDEWLDQILTVALTLPRARRRIALVVLRAIAVGDLQQP